MNNPVKVNASYSGNQNGALCESPKQGIRPLESILSDYAKLVSENGELAAATNEAILRLGVPVNAEAIPKSSTTDGNNCLSLAERILADFKAVTYYHRQNLERINSVL